MDRRRQILMDADLLAAPRTCQQAFWMCRNQKFRRRPAVRLGEVAFDLVSDAAVAGASEVPALARAWREVIPCEYRGLAAVESYRDGKLVVTVDSAATKYALGRRLGDEFMSAMNRVASSRVRRIVFRVGAAPQAEASPRKGEGRGGQ